MQFHPSPLGQPHTESDAPSVPASAYHEQWHIHSGYLDQAPTIASQSLTPSSAYEHHPRGVLQLGDDYSMSSVFPLQEHAYHSALSLAPPTAWESTSLATLQAASAPHFGHFNQGDDDLEYTPCEPTLLRCPEADRFHESVLSRSYQQGNHPPGLPLHQHQGHSGMTRDYAPQTFSYISPVPPNELPDDAREFTSLYTMPTDMRFNSSVLGFDQDFHARSGHPSLPSTTLNIPNGIDGPWLGFNDTSKPPQALQSPNGQFIPPLSFASEAVVSQESACIPQRSTGHSLPGGQLPNITHHAGGYPAGEARTVRHGEGMRES